MKFSPQIKLYRKLRYRKGYGVHSPFTYNLITKVIEERTPYYVFDDIENFRKELLSEKDPVGAATAKEAQSRNYGALLFRLVNFFKPATILQVGGSTGLMSLYLALPLKNRCRCFVMEERTGMLQAIQSFAENHSLKNIHPVEGVYCDTLQRLKSEITSFDFIFINMTGDSEKTLGALQMVTNFTTKETILVIDKIRLNKAMKKLWQDIKNRPDVGPTIDLLSLGLVFFNTKLHKQHYKNYFDDGKKQNLYTKRRRRFNLFGRRKKGIQSRFPH